jgi:sugar lactone lactonase YvrE
VAGTKRGGYAGDGGPATAAALNAPFDICLLDDGAILVADTYNHRIRRIDRDGTIRTVAGNGKSGLSGDNGPAIQASLDTPQGIAADSRGNLYIADTFNHVVRCVDAKGVITTVAGSEPGLSGDGGPAVEAQLNLPMAVNVDGQDRLYISDAGNSRIRRVTSDGRIETVVGHGQGAGIGGAGFEGDGGRPEAAKIFSAADVKFGPLDNLYISDSGNNRIRLVFYGIISTVAGTGEAGFGGDGEQAIDAVFKAPQKIAVSRDGTVFVADRANHRVRLVDRKGRVSTLVGDGEPDVALRVAGN